LILELSQAYARQKPLKPTGRLRELNGEEFVIAFISADLVDHPTAHLVAAQLMEMRNFATLKVLCVAKPERVESMNPSSPYRRAIKERCGDIFLDVGHLSDKEIADKLTAANPHVILHAGFHQDADRVNVLLGGLRALAVQYVGHAGSTGYSRFDYIIGSKTALPAKNKDHFTEKLLRMGAPFHGNSFREFFRHDDVRLHTLRTDTDTRSNEREFKYGLKRDCQILLNISYPNRLIPRFWDIICRVLKENPRAVLVLVDHVKAFRLRWLARFESMGLGGRLCFVRFNPHKFNLDDSKDPGPPLEERLQRLHAEVTRHIGRLERGENSAFLEVWHLYYPEGTEDYCGEAIAPEGL
jgi:predicted O-linked N-acetylglucosamine transferase (SPINDLY family)